jgi:chromosome segregation protein
VALFLKKVELLGFKSFADKTQIDFTDGISALLGPNGCGKSNVVDAIKWVLGEQATKSLRAEKMEDVIFNGTESRKALNVAEVELTLHNEQNVLSLDLPEVTVKRRLFRSGDSEYYINNTPVRLKELKELFFDTGIGKSAYSIMEQGKIDQILSNKPEERRNLFEEAAAITKYKAKGREAELKLNKTKENMRQVESILSEVKRTYDNLKKQADKTEKYRSLKDNEFNLDRDIYLLRLRSLLEEQDKKKNLVEDRLSARNEAKSGIDAINETLESNLDQVNSMETELIEAQKLLYGMEIELNNNKNQQRLFEERIEEIKQKIIRDEQRHDQVKEKQKQLNEDIESREKSIVDFVGRLEDIAKNIKEFTERIESNSTRIKDNKVEISKAELNIKHLNNRQQQIQKDLQSLTDDIVARLDVGLKEVSYSSQSRTDLEKQLAGYPESFKRLMGKIISRTEDLDHSGTFSKASVQEVYGEVQTQLEELIIQMQEDLSAYAQLFPQFLDDFLAPEGIITKKRSLESEYNEANDSKDQLQNTISELSKENDELNQKSIEYRSTSEELKVNEARLKAQKNALEQEQKRNQQELTQTQNQANEIKKIIAEDTGRISGLETQIKELEKNHSSMVVEEKKLRSQLEKLEKGISTKNQSLIKKEKELKSAMDKLAKIQEKLEQQQMQLAGMEVEIRNVFDNFRERYSRDLAEFQDGMYEISGDLDSLRNKFKSNKETIRGLGSINLMAVEEFQEIKERFEFLNNQMADLQQAQKDLEAVTVHIQKESAELFSRTYEKIKKNFHMLFRRLFGGGRAELRLQDPDDMLQSGIEIYAQPPGKKLENIALLSGGERSLTAVALLFATYMVKPSPFCLLDEIDAALDESNVGRFVNMLMEFANTSQFIIITHNKKTVAGAQTLLGVTMEESGISKVVSIRLGSTEEEEGIPLHHNT